MMAINTTGQEDTMLVQNRNLITAPSLVMTKGSFTWLILSSFRTVPTPTVSLEHEFFLKELFFYRYSGIASETTLLIRFRLVMRFRRTLQDPGLSMCSADLVLPLKSLNCSRSTLNMLLCNNIPHPTESMHTEKILKHRGTGPDDLDHFLMCPITGLNPEAAESTGTMLLYERLIQSQH
ncbi:hypothetical protein L1887_15184 [Cichorium endivia]|nr:hypothetical protein L1887_15184 [Cichorium endivia]